MKVSLDDEILNIWKNNPFMFQTTKQLGILRQKIVQYRQAA